MQMLLANNQINFHSWHNCIFMEHPHILCYTLYTLEWCVYVLFVYRWSSITIPKLVDRSLLIEIRSENTHCSCAPHYSLVEMGLIIDTHTRTHTHTRALAAYPALWLNPVNMYVRCMFGAHRQFACECLVGVCLCPAQHNFIIMLKQIPPSTLRGNPAWPQQFTCRNSPFAPCLCGRLWVCGLWSIRSDQMYSNQLILLDFISTILVISHMPFCVAPNERNDGRTNEIWGVVVVGTTAFILCLPLSRSHSLCTPRAVTVISISNSCTHTRTQSRYTLHISHAGY